MYLLHGKCLYNTCVGVYVTFNRELLANNSNITETKAGDSLNCHTDQPNCCDINSEGKWYSQGTDKDNDLVVDRTQGTISLNLNNIAIGTLCCAVQDIDNMDQTLCIAYSEYNSLHSCVGYETHASHFF